MREQCEKLTLTSRAFFNDTLGEYCQFASETFGYERCRPRAAAAAVVVVAEQWRTSLHAVSTASAPEFIGISLRHCSATTTTAAAAAAAAVAVA